MVIAVYFTNYVEVFIEVKSDGIILEAVYVHSSQIVVVADFAGVMVVGDIQKEVIIARFEGFSD